MGAQTTSEFFQYMEENSPKLQPKSRNNRIIFQRTITIYLIALIEREIHGKVFIAGQSFF